MTKNKRKVIFTPVSTFTKYIQNEEHYSEVIARIYVKQDGESMPLLGQLAELVQPAIEQFDTLWMGSHCKNCGRQEFCGDRIK